MPIELAKIALKRVHRIETVEQSALVYHRVPGLEGSIAQDLGRDSVRLRIEGIYYGQEAKKGLEKLRAVYLKREPVDFIADIVGQAYVGKVVLERLEVHQSAQEPDQFSYSLVVAEYVPPPQRAASTAAIDLKLQMDAKAMLDVGTLPDALALGSLPEISNPFQPLNNALEPVQQAVGGLNDAVDGLRQLFGLESG
jgi:hypothetical protein